jgi:AmmeMemoRadiSam system protein B
MGIRKADFAGSWYPGRPDDCEREILSFLKDKNISRPSGKPLIGGIVPHAGWYFSGSIACNVISALKDEIPPDIVVIFGMHLHEDSPCYIMKEGDWETPFGNIQIADELTGKLIEKFSFNIETAENYQPDNTIELQLPFVKYVFENVKIAPIGVPPATESLRIGEAVAEIASELGLKIKVLGSTDLTHYGYNYGFVTQGTGPAAVDWVRNTNDRRVIDAMLDMRPDNVSPVQNLWAQPEPSLWLMPPATIKVPGIVSWGMLELFSHNPDKPELQRFFLTILLVPQISWC